MNRSLLRLTLLACMLIAMMQTEAQGWMKKYAPDRMMAINTIIPQQGGYLTTGWGLHDSTQRQRIMKVDEQGAVVWQRLIDSVYNVSFTTVHQQGGLIIMGASPTHLGAPQAANIVKTDANGQKVWQHILHPEWAVLRSIANADLDTTDDGGFVAFYTAIDSTGGNTHSHPYLTRFDAAGNKLWDHEYFATDTVAVPYVVRNNATGGGFLLVASHTTQSTQVIVKVDESGNEEWTYTPAGLRYLTPVVAPDGNIVVAESMYYNGGVSYVTGLSPAGATLWSHQYAIPDSMGWVGLLVHADYHLTLLGGTYNGTDKYSISIADTAGHILNYRRINISNLGPQQQITNAGGKSFARANDGGVIFGGWIPQDVEGYSAFIIKTDSVGQVYPSTVSGIVFADGNSNCVKDSAEITVPRAYVSYANAHDTFTTLTHSGYYALGLDTGSYSLGVVPPSPYWEPSACNPTTVNLPAGTDSVINLGVTPIVSAPYIVINGHLGRQALCRPVTYTAQYCNTGTAPFTGIIQLTVDTLLRVDSSSVAWGTHVGNVYTFLLNPLNALQCGTIELYCTTTCDVTRLGRTACVNAQAIQDTIVNANALWDGSNLRMSVSYDQATDSVTFLLKNQGAGPMAGPQSLTVIEDNVILITTPIQLPAGAQITKGFHANGSTLRATVPQTPYNPYSTFTTAAIEAVGTNGAGGVSLGYITQYPYNGYTSFNYLECGEVRGAYDPNEKHVLPKGAGTDHLVDTNTVLEYAIDFQNTGTDTAYAVTLVDTLAPYLDPSTLRLVSSSHDVKLTIVRNVATFTISNARVPDSATNLLGSMGFVKFSIRQRAHNVIGTVINNNAGIIFDYNPPVITNTVTVRIGRVLLTGIQTLYSKPLDITAYPNPFTTTTTISIEGDDFRTMTLRIYDLTGRVVRTQEVQHLDHFVLDREGLASGSYLFEVWGDGQKIGTGKMIAD